MKTLGFLSLALLALAACGDDAAPGGDDAGHDAPMLDAGPDAGSDGGSDAGPCGPPPAGTVSLASTMALDSRIAEVDITGSQARIEFGDGTPGDADGLYDVNDPSIMYGRRGLDIYPREAAFEVGTLTVDASGATGCGTETLAVTALDLGPLWSDDTLEADISGAEMRVWLFGVPVEMRFGAPDANDTATFTAGVLTSLDVEVTLTLSVDYSAGFGDPTVYEGVLRFTGDAIALSLDDTVLDVRTAMGTQPQSQGIVDVRGTVAAVSGG